MNTKKTIQADIDKAAAFSRTFLEDTIKIWQPAYDCQLTLEDGREIATNVTSILELLAEVDRVDNKDEGATEP